MLFSKPSLRTQLTFHQRQLRHYAAAYKTAAPDEQRKIYPFLVGHADRVEQLKSQLRIPK